MLADDNKKVNSALSTVLCMVVAGLMLFTSILFSSCAGLDIASKGLDIIKPDAIGTDKSIKVDTEINGKKKVTTNVALNKKTNTIKGNSGTINQVEQTNGINPWWFIVALIPTMIALFITSPVEFIKKWKLARKELKEKDD